MTAGWKPYDGLSGLSQVFLEDSWVLDVVVRPSELTLRLDVVLREEHGRYQPPRPGEQYCYSKGSLIFSDVRQVEWEMSETRPAVDATGEIDYGNIDALEFAGDRFRLEGEFGRIAVSAAGVELQLDDPDAG